MKGLMAMVRATCLLVSWEMIEAEVTASENLKENITLSKSPYAMVVKKEASSWAAAQGGCPALSLPATLPG